MGTTRRIFSDENADADVHGVVQPGIRELSRDAGTRQLEATDRATWMRAVLSPEQVPPGVGAKS